MLRRAFFASAAAAIAAPFCAPAKCRVIERLESGRWVPRWLAEVKAGDRFRVAAGRLAGNEYVLEADPVRTGDRSYRVAARLVFAKGHEPSESLDPGDYEPCSSN